MSGTTSASIVGVKRWSSPSVASIGRAKRELERVQELERVLAHDDDELRLDDPKLAPSHFRRRLDVAAGELDAVRPEHLERVDVEPLAAT